MSEKGRKTKIARIIARLNVGGPARHVVWLTEALQDENCESILIAGRVPEGEEDMAYFAAGHDVEPVFIEDMSRELSLSDLSALFKIWRKLVEFGPDIVHTHTAKAGTLGRAAAFLYKWFTPKTLIGKPRRVRVFHTFHGHIFQGYYSSLKTSLFLFIEKVLAKFATDKIVVISKQQALEIGETYRVASPGKIEIVRLGLDLSGFESADRETNSLRKEIGIKENELLVGIVGRLTEIKNHRLFIEAVKMFEGSSDFRNVRFVIIGDGHLRQELEELAVGTGVVYAGNRDDAAEFYGALDLVALTSLNEGTPLTLIEAMACGKPWVASSVGGVVDLAGGRIEDSEVGSQEGSSGIGVQGAESSELEVQGAELDQTNSKRRTQDPKHSVRVCERGVLFESEDVSGFVDGLKLLLDDAELRESMGVKGRAFVYDNYTKERLVEDIRKLYGI